jgi:hypothetical protein
MWPDYKRIIYIPVQTRLFLGSRVQCLMFEILHEIIDYNRCPWGGHHYTIFLFVAFTIPNVPRRNKSIHWNKVHRTWRTSKSVSNGEVCSGRKRTESGSWIKFHKNEVLAKIWGYVDRLLKEAIKIKLQSDNINREEGLKLSKSRTPCTNLLKHCNTHKLRKPRKETEETMQKRKQNTLTTGTQG